MSLEVQILSYLVSCRKLLPFLQPVAEAAASRLGCQVTTVSQVLISTTTRPSPFDPRFVSFVRRIRLCRLLYSDAYLRRTILLLAASV